MKKIITFVSLALMLMAAPVQAQNVTTVDAKAAQKAEKERIKAEKKAAKERAKAEKLAAKNAQKVTDTKSVAPISGTKNLLSSHRATPQHTSSVSRRQTD